jgi:hypothetical protein
MRSSSSLPSSSSSSSISVSSSAAVVGKGSSAASNGGGGTALVPQLLLTTTPREPSISRALLSERGAACEVRPTPRGRAGGGGGAGEWGPPASSSACVGVMGRAPPGSQGREGKFSVGGKQSYGV